MRRTAILWIFILLAGCTPEKPVMTPSVVVSNVVPELTAQGATAEVTSRVSPSPIVVEDCARGDYFDEIESGGQTRQ